MDIETYALMASNIITFLLCGVVLLGLLDHFRTDRLTRSSGANRISGTRYVWREDLDGIVLERLGLLLWGERRWVFGPDRATVGPRSLPMRGYQLIAVQAGANTRITVQGFSPDGEVVTLFEDRSTTRGSWTALESALKGLSPRRLDAGSEDDIPEVLRTMREQLPER